VVLHPALPAGQSRQAAGRCLLLHHEHWRRLLWLGVLARVMRTVKAPLLLLLLLLLVVVVVLLLLLYLQASCT
jgi:hypothetical protein